MAGTQEEKTLAVIIKKKRVFILFLKPSVGIVVKG